MLSVVRQVFMNKTIIKTNVIYMNYHKDLLTKLIIVNNNNEKFYLWHNII